MPLVMRTADDYRVQERRPMEVACRMPRQLGVAQVQVQVQVQVQAQACVGDAALPAATLFMRHNAAAMTCFSGA